MKEEKLEITVRLGSFEPNTILTGTLEQVHENLDNIMLHYENYMEEYKKVVFEPEYSYYDNPSSIHVNGVRDETEVEYQQRIEKKKKFATKKKASLSAKKAKLEKDLEKLTKEMESNEIE